MRSTSEILADIRRQPERDDLRFEYADACQAKDPDYARYIRTELEYWRPGSSIDTPRGSRRVATRIAHPFEKYCYSVELNRGFVEEVTMDPYIFIDHGDKLLDLAPIRMITFTPKPSPPGLDRPPFRQVVPSAVPEVMACPHIARVYGIDFDNSNFQTWYLEDSDIEAMLTSKYLDRLLTFTLPGGRTQDSWRDDYCAGVWERAFARPEFRKMLTVDFPHYPGEISREYDDDWERVTEPIAMGAQGRAFEQEHGYLPSLHEINVWGANPSGPLWHDELVLGVLRGELPKFPVGAPVTEEMYALPPAKRRTTGNNW